MGDDGGPGTKRRKRRYWVIVAAALLLSGIAAFKISGARCFTLVGDAICRVETSEKLVALSFDDGPTSAGVDWSLTVLSRYGVKATFFLIGKEMEARPGLARRLLEAGHELGNHSYSHKRMVARSAGFYAEEIARTDALLRQEGNPSPSLFRPPYGKKLIGLPQAVERHGYLMIMWDVEDPSETDPRRYAEQVVRQARPGSIILMHLMYRSNRTAREALPLVVEGLQARGFRIIPVGELIQGRS